MTHDEIMSKYRQTVLSDGDLTITIQNTFERPKDQPTGDFSVEVWHVIMTSPYFDSGVYNRARVDSYEAGYDMALNQFNEEFGCVHSRDELVAMLKRIDF